MLKPFTVKFSILFGIAGFGLSLLVLLAIPMLAGWAIASSALVVAQSIGIAVCMVLVFAWLYGRMRGADGSDATALTEQIRFAAGDSVDPVTRLLNQRGLTVSLLELMALGERYGNDLTVAIIGIDNLEDVRERYGEAAADNAMIAISGELADTLRMPDRLGRWNDDQLIAILPETALDGARHIGERLREAASHAQFDARRGVVLTLTASIGVTVFRMGDDLKGLLARASRAMNAARQQGSNQVRTDLAA